MNIRHFWTSAMVAALAVAPAASFAQHRHDDYAPSNQYDRRYNEIERLVVHAERQSNAFRAQFERLWDSRRDRDFIRSWDNDWSRGRPDRRDDRGERDRWERDRWDRPHDFDRYDRYDRDDDYRYSRRYSPKDAVQRMDEALERLRSSVTRNSRDRYRGGGFGYGNRPGHREMMEVARAVDNVDFYFARGRNFNSSLERHWDHLKSDLSPLFRYYNVRMGGRW